MSNEGRTPSGTSSAMSKEAFEEILKDPKANFDDPNDVLTADNLTDVQKADILRAWEDDARQLMAAAEEDMQGGEEANLSSIVTALRELKVSSEN